MISVLLVDDHAVVRQGLKLTLADAYAGAAFGEACNGDQAVERVEQGTWDVVVLDIGLPARNGLEVLEALRALAPDLPVLVLSMYPEDQFAIRALRAGAAGYMTKEAASDALVEAVATVLRGGKYITPTVADQLVASLTEDGERLPHETLSDREYQVLCQLASGKTVSHIARDLELSVKTVSTYRTHILKKLQVSNNVDLSLYAIKHGLIHQ